LIDQMHEIALDLRPKMLDDLGLTPTLKWYCKRFASRYEIPVEFESKFDTSIDPDWGTVLYRITQEALTNIVKHANATHVYLCLERVENNLTLLIRDDGVGFDKDNPNKEDSGRHGAGLINMIERVDGIGATISIESKPGSGTEISVLCPLERFECV